MSDIAKHSDFDNPILFIDELPTIGTLIWFIPPIDSIYKPFMIEFDSEVIFTDKDSWYYV